MLIVGDLSANDLREHLAYEVHYLVLTAVQFAKTEEAAYQDSSLLHARNLLEFTNPGKASRFTWWIGDVGGQKPPGDDTTHAAWNDFINSNASHLGKSRLKARQWPVPKDRQRLIVLSEYLLQRVHQFSRNGGNERALIMETLSQLGLRYLDDPSAANLAKIARAIDAPL